MRPSEAQKSEAETHMIGHLKGRICVRVRRSLRVLMRSARAGFESLPARCSGLGITSLLTRLQCS